mgnify:CR=1 FL=1
MSSSTDKKDEQKAPSRPSSPNPDTMSTSYKPPSFGSLDASQKLNSPEEFPRFSRTIMLIMGRSCDKIFKDNAPPNNNESSPEWQRWDQLQSHATAFLVSSLGPKMADIIPASARTLKDVWHSLLEAYNPASANTVEVLVKKLQAHRCEEHPSIDQFDSFTREAKYLVEQLKARDLSIDDMYFLLFQNALPESLGTTIEIFTATNKIVGEDGKITFPSIESLASAAREIVVKDSAKDTIASALNASTSRGKKGKGKRGPPPKPCWVEGCGQLHWVDECTHPNAKKEQEKLKSRAANRKANNSSRSTSTSAHIADTTTKEESKDKETTSLNAETSDFSHGLDSWIANSVSTSDSLIVLDSGASKCMTGDFSLLHNVKKMEEIKINGIAPGAATSIVGEMKLRTSTGREINFGTVFFVPTLTQTLVSTTVLTKSFGFNVLIFSSGAVVKDKSGRTVMTASTTKGGLLRLDLASRCTSPSPSAFVASSKKTDALTWHNRMCHLSLSAIQKLAKSGAVTGLDVAADDNVSDEVNYCEACTKAKAVRLPFPPNPKIAFAPLDLVHSDLLSFGEDTFGGYRYAMTLLDDHSRMLEVRLLKRKSDAFTEFKNWLAIAERGSGKKLKVFHTDNGGEYLSNGFNAFLRDNGIDHHLTVPYTPQNNARAERVNRTLIEAVRAIINKANVDHRWWGEAIQFVVHVYNRSGHTAIDGDTPLHRWNGSTPSLEHLRTFGCEAFVKKPRQKQGLKLDPVVVRSMMVGFDKSSKMYRLWDMSLPPSKGIIKARDVYFNERSFPFASEDNVRGDGVLSRPSPPSVCPTTPLSFDAPTLLTPPLGRATTPTPSSRDSSPTPSPHQGGAPSPRSSSSTPSLSSSSSSSSSSDDNDSEVSHSGAAPGQTRVRFSDDVEQIEEFSLV